MKPELETIAIAGGGYIARPQGAVGTIGWSPFPWEATWGETSAIAISNFHTFHSRFYKEAVNG